MIFKSTKKNLKKACNCWKINSCRVYNGMRKKEIFLQKRNKLITASDSSIAEGRIRVANKDNAIDDGKAIRVALKKASVKAPVGASYRWAINTSAGGSFQLQLQSLPAPLPAVEGSPTLMEDNVAVVQIYSWPIQGTVFDGQIARGPVPVFFSEDPVLTARCLDDNPKSILFWHTRVMDRYVTHQCLELPFPKTINRSIPKKLNHFPPYSRVEAWIWYFSRGSGSEKALGYPRKARHADSLQFLKNVGWIQ